MAPTVYFEQLEYDTRLMNQAVKGGKKDILQLQQLFVESDTYYDPQAFILSPHNVIEISKEIVKGQDYINATKKGCLKGLSLVENALFEGKLLNDKKEESWIEILKTDIESIPTNESEFIESILPTIDKKKILLSEYGL
jgi:methanol--5-hydroxybenzimidazolylcobamide Co-methyltransferase